MEDGKSVCFMDTFLHTGRPNALWSYHKQIKDPSDLVCNQPIATFVEYFKLLKFNNFIRKKNRKGYMKEYWDFNKPYENVENKSECFLKDDWKYQTKGKLFS